MKLHNAEHLVHLIGGGAGDIREFPYREKIAVDLDFLPGVSFAAYREFPHCKKIAADGKLLQTIHSGQIKSSEMENFYGSFGIMKGRST